jgi:hypothetical protein
MERGLAGVTHPVLSDAFSFLSSRVSLGPHILCAEHVWFIIDANRAGRLVAFYVQSLPTDCGFYSAFLFSQLTIL